MRRNVNKPLTNRAIEPGTVVRCSCNERITNLEPGEEISSTGVLRSFYCRNCDKFIKVRVATQ